MDPDTPQGRSCRKPDAPQPERRHAVLDWFHYGTPVTDYTKNDYLTVAYRTSDGNLNWSKTYNGPVGNEDDPWALALSPDGSRVFVTGWSWSGTSTKSDQATVAYAASDGTPLWTNRFDSPNHDWNWGATIAVSPDGSTVYTGGSRARALGANLTNDYEGTSIDASDGSLNWAAFYNGPGDYTGKYGYDLVTSVDVAPDGSRRFLARHFYYERVVHFFKYSRALARVTGRRPEEVLSSDGFEALLPGVVLSSRETASEVAALVVQEQLRGTHASIPYFEDLLRYQEAMMVVEAGPRDWRGPGVATTPAEDAFAQVVEGTMVLELDHDLPAVFPSLLGPWNEPPNVPRQKTSLVVARSPQARVSVLRVNPALIGLLREVDRPRSIRELAEQLRLEPSALEAVLHDLAGVGAVRFSIGS